MTFVAALVLFIGLWLSLTQVEDSTMALVIYAVLALGLVGLAHVDDKRGR